MKKLPVFFSYRMDVWVDVGNGDEQQPSGRSGTREKIHRLVETRNDSVVMTTVKNHREILRGERTWGI